MIAPAQVYRSRLATESLPIESTICCIVDQTRQEEKLAPIDAGWHASDSFRLRSTCPFCCGSAFGPTFDRPGYRLKRTILSR
jgi:hypothetical protein